MTEPVFGTKGVFDEDYLYFFAAGIPAWEAARPGAMG